MTLDVVLSLALVVLTPAVGWLLSTVIAHRKAIARIEQGLEQQVTREDLREVGEGLQAGIGKLEVHLTRLEGDLRVKDEQVDSIKLIVRRHEQWLASDQM